MSAPIILCQFPRVQDALLKSRDRFDASLLRYDAWFQVLVAVLFTLGVVLTVAMAAWCVMFEHKHFTGAWRLVNWGITADFECR